MDDTNRIHNIMRGPSPCANCTERFTACWDHCPKDKRADPKNPGYQMWKAQAEELKKKSTSYKKAHFEDYKDEKRRDAWRRKTS